MVLRHATQHRTRTRKVLGSIAACDFYHAQVQRFDGPARRGSHRDQVPAATHELFDTRSSFGIQAAGQLFGRRTFRTATIELAATRAGQDEVLGFDASRAQMFIAHGGVAQAKVLKEPAHPALIHVTAPRRVHSDLGLDSLYFSAQSIRVTLPGERLHLGHGVVRTGDAPRGRLERLRHFDAF